MKRGPLVHLAEDQARLRVKMRWKSRRGKCNRCRDSWRILSDGRLRPHLNYNQWPAVPCSGSYQRPWIVRKWAQR